MQLAACTPNFGWLETMATDVPWRSEVAVEHHTVAAGRAVIGDAPGLGVDIDEEALRRHPYRVHELRHYAGTLTDIRPADAVFRGTVNAFGTAAAASFIAASGKPVLGFYDFDPEGLVMAASEPRLEALCLPARERLVAATEHFRRDHLYLDQLPGCRVRLDALQSGPVRDGWLLLKDLQRGLNQENFPR